MVSVNRMNTTLADAITNDARGVVSRKDAEKLVYAGVKEIFSSDDPLSTYEGNQRYIGAARALLGKDKAAKKALDAYSARGMGAVAVRLEQLTGNKQLPLELKDRFVENLVDHEVVESASDIKISNVKGDKETGFSFDYTIGDEKRTGYAVPYQGDLFLSPVKLDSATLDAAVEAMKTAMGDEDFFDGWEMSDDEISATLDAIVPDRAKFPGEYSDPYNYTDDYPVVLVMSNDTGSDHGFFVGIDPANPNDASGYTFN